MPFFGFEGPEYSAAATVVLSPVWSMSMWLCCFVAPAWRVLYAPEHVIAPVREARFALRHALAAVFSDFPLRSGNFGVF